MPEGYKQGKPDVSYWFKEIRMGLQYRKDSAYETKWDRWRQYYRGEWQGNILPANVFFKMVRSIVPRIYFRNPSVSITPATPGLENAIMAKLQERVDNKLIRAMGLKTQMKRIVQDAWMFGTGFGKKGFGSQYQASPESIGETLPPDASRPGARLKNLVEYNYNIMPNMPWFLKTSPKTVILPNGCDYIEEARWVCYVINRPVEDIKADPRLKNTSTMGVGHLSEEAFNTTKKVARDLVLGQLFEIHDKKTGMVFVISPQAQDKTLLFAEDEFARLKIDTLESLVFNDDDERAWGIPDSQILEPNQLEINEIRTYMMYHRRLSIARILAKRGVLSETDGRKLVGPDVDPIVAIDGNPQTDIKLFETTEGIPRGLIDSYGLTESDIRESLGFSRNEAGEFQQGSRKPTAAEVAVVRQASTIRVDERRDMVADMLVRIVNNFHPIIYDHWTQPQVEEIIGPAGIPFWIQFRPRMLSKTAFNIKVDPDQMQPLTRDVREAKAMAIYEVLKTNPLIDPFMLTSYLLREFHGVQFDEMMRGLEPGTGLTPDRPFTPGQFGELIQRTSRVAPQLLTGPAVAAPPVRDEDTEE